jgi:hypothetical protein
MGQRVKDNFSKRFGGEICIVYAKKSSASEEGIQDGELCKAIIKVLSGILGREPTPKEILGIEDISKKNMRKRNAIK